MAINGMRATSEITPNESFVFPQPFAAPIVKESTNVEVNGPEATPPESNAIPVNKSGQNIIKTKAMTYPGIRIKRRLMPAIERHKESPIAIAVPKDKKTRSDISSKIKDRINKLPESLEETLGKQFTVFLYC